MPSTAPADDDGHRAAGRRRVRPRDALRSAGSAAIRTTSRSTATPCAARGRSSVYADPKGDALAADLAARRGFRARAARLRPHHRGDCVEPGRAGDDRSRRALSLRRAGARPVGRRRRRPEAGHRAFGFPRLQLRPRRRDGRGGARAASIRKRAPTTTARRPSTWRCPSCRRRPSRSRPPSSSA